MAAVNPELAQSLVQNPEALMQLLGVSPDQMGGDFEMGDEEGGGGVPPGAQVVNVSEEERAAIERVSARFFWLLWGLLIIVWWDSWRRSGSRDRL